MVSALLGSLPPEGRLRVECISLSAEPESRTRAAEHASGGIDWERLLQYAAGHFVVPPVHNALSECVNRVPASMRKRLRHAHACIAMQQRRGAQELVQVSAELASAGASSIALKGPALAMQAYGRIDARQCGDLDILIRAGDLPLIAAVLGKRGYRAEPNQERPPNIAFFDVFEEKFVSQRGRVDLHLDFLPSYFPFPDREAMRRDAVSITLEDSEVLTLARADQLIFSILHATKHGWGWGSLRSMCDIARLTATGLADWEQTEEEMAGFGCGRMCHLGAVLSHAFAGAAVPRPVLDRATSDKKVMRLAAQTACTLFPVPDLHRSGWFFQLNAIQGFGWRARYLLNRGLRPTIAEWESLPLPRAFYWVYYLTHPARLAVHHGVRLFSRRAQAADQ